VLKCHSESQYDISNVILQAFSVISLQNDIANVILSLKLTFQKYYNYRVGSLVDYNLLKENILCYNLSTMATPVSNSCISRFTNFISNQPNATKVALGVLALGVIGLGAYGVSSYMKNNVQKSEDPAIPPKEAAIYPKFSRDVLFVIFSKLTTANAMGGCYLTCKEWKAVIDEHDVLWKPIALRNALGENIWKESVNVNVGDVPCYRVHGQPVLWKAVYAMHKSPSLFNAAKRVEEMEIDFLVPATLGGQPTTIRRVLEVFTRVRLPTQCTFFNSDFLAKYGDIPIGESYWARYTITVVEGTRKQEPQVRVQMIHEKGQGLYRLPMIIEHIIFTFLLYQAGKKCGYGRDPLTLSQTIETINDHGHEHEHPIYAGAFVGDELFVYFERLVVDKRHGAGGLRKF
jgi:hypothetical protein